MLSFVAGVVNISGVLSIHTLTTNVTGHFAFFSEYFVQGHYQVALDFVSYIAAFLLGAFCCGFLVEVLLRKKPAISHTIPMLLETAILIIAAFANASIPTEWLARVLLFSMGLQNALVTKISQATVRTTHLTGLFTDLGIELSQLFFYRNTPSTKKLSRSIYLRLAIIAFFFLGGVIGGFLYTEIRLYTLLLAAGALLTALAYDNLRFGFHYYVRKMRSKA
ncbi:YoaK family protein [Dawidia soli]|nr:YoaK family protein [Dawidia soli]